MRTNPPRDEAALQRLREVYISAAQKDDANIAAVVAGEAADLVQRAEPAANIVRRMADEAESILTARPGLR